MDTVTVAATLVIRMTGLLLFVPDEGTEGRPTHILMPASANVPAHVAQVGYRTSSSAGCDYYRHRICYFNVTGYSLRLPAGTPAGNSAPLPPGAFNVTAAVNRRVPRSFLNGDPPSDRVRTRVTLPAGEITRRCALARFTVAGHPGPVELDNVVDWTISNVPLPGGWLVLERVPFGGGAPDTIVNVRVGEAERFELFVRQVPENEKHHPEHGPGAVLGDSAAHVHAFYDLLGVDPGGERPIPKVSGTVLPGACPWAATATGPKAMVNASPTTVNCMVGSALPET